MERLAEKERNDGQRWRRRANTLSHVQEGRLNGFFDSSAGFTYADKACTWARHLAEKEGVKFVLGPQVGELDGLLVECLGHKKRVRGLRTVDGKNHLADVVVVACECQLPIQTVKSCVTILTKRWRVDSRYHTRNVRQAGGNGRERQHNRPPPKSARSVG